MQAITTLHAQLCLATEKLETAQNLLIAQKNVISNVEEEGRIKQTEIMELNRLLISSKQDQRSELEKLGELKSQTLPLEIEFQRVSGALEVLPFAFRKLSVDFTINSRNMMGRINSLLSLAIKENFWKNKIMMNLHHLNASGLRLKQLTATLKQALIDEENSLNQQLAEEESSLAMVQACIETMEMKNGQAFFEKETRDKPQSFTSSYLLDSSELPRDHTAEISDKYNRKQETAANIYLEKGSRRYNFSTQYLMQW